MAKQDMTAEEIAEATQREMREIAALNGHDEASIEDLADDGLDEEETETYIEGTTGQLSLTVGGRKPDSSTFKMKGAEVKVRQGQYTKGETVVLRVIARLDEVKFIDMHDDYGTITATKRVHTAKPISIERIEEDGDLG